ncbi:hypothetical protein BSK71_01720 [Pectobacterium actinidiae]|uniref:Uncharacterized protein n=1 Tax=Pectobacterium actinidiae TaxID=1507808 RepID=A0A1V2R9F1_9GAMM|nr:hypothetical protein BSK69_01155 [Pectobacterium actinidiae]ONK08975.1 hypothetical protein BSK71_01720 [Pectobacterium actinidiae]
MSSPIHSFFYQAVSILTSILPQIVKKVISSRHGCQRPAPRDKFQQNEYDRSATKEAVIRIAKRNLDER